MSDDKDECTTPERTGYTGYTSSDSSLCSDPSRNFSMELDVCCSGEEKCTRPVDKAGLVRCEKCNGWYHEGVCGDAYPAVCPVSMKERFIFMCELCSESVKVKETEELKNDTKHKNERANHKRDCTMEDSMPRVKKHFKEKY
jgi:hypothetical protein